MLSQHKIYRYVGNHTGVYQIFMETYFRYHICCKRVKFQRSSMYIVYNYYHSECGTFFVIVNLCDIAEVQTIITNNY